jgi:hypothetical protein
MIKLALTPKLAGISIAGDAADLSRLAEALLDVVSDEAEPGSDYEMPALAILALYDELRKAVQGERQLVFADNGLTGEMRQRFKILAPQRNVYFQTRLRLPELLFDIMALNDFIERAGYKRKVADLDPPVQLARWFQAEVTATLQGQMDAAAAGRLASLIYGTVPRYKGFCTQYVDNLCCQYMAHAPERRKQQILPLARRLDELGADYQRMLVDLRETAAELACAVSELEPVNELPALGDQDW